MRQVLVDGTELDIVHLAKRTPWHPFAEFMTAGVFAGAQGGDELLATPIGDETEARPDRRPLALNAAAQLLAVAFPAVLIGQNVFAIGDGLRLGRRRDDAGIDRLAGRSGRGLVLVKSARAGDAGQR